MKQALVIGAGETAGAAARALSSLKFENIAIANRTLEKAEELARQVHGSAYGLDQISALVAQADVIIAAVAVPYTLVDASMIANRNQPLLLVDLAIPANIAPDCNDCPGVSLLGLEQLKLLAASNKPLLDRELSHAAKIVNEGIEKLRGDFKMSEISPWIKQSRSKLAAVGVEEIDAMMGHEFKDLTPEQAAQIRSRLERMVKRLLHVSTENYKDHARSRSPSG
jgi:glutamyl-tRNA reductase